MSDFLRVLGDDPEDKGRKAYLFVHRSVICKVYPVWGVEKDGRFCSCTPQHEGARVISCRLVDLQGKVYSCGKVGELRKLLGDEDLARLFGETPEQKRIGFEGGRGAEDVDFTDSPGPP
jgi:hypothetical protein